MLCAIRGLHFGVAHTNEINELITRTWPYYRSCPHLVVLLPMLQVPAQCLSDYLLEMKQDYGYTVVGAEQSTNSKSLKDYHMPAKTLLLLG